MAQTRKQRGNASTPWYERLTYDEILERDREAWNLPRPRPARTVTVRTVAGVPSPGVTYGVPARGGTQ